MLDEVLGALRRFPDIEAPNLYAVDGADRLILEVSADLPNDVVVIGDNYGALTLGLVASGCSAIRVHQDSLLGERALAANAERAGLGGFAWLPLGESLVDDARAVLLRVPKSLSELTEIAELIAAYAGPDVRVFAGGRDKHLSPNVRETLLRYFGTVETSRGRYKSHVLIASSPLPATVTYPRTVVIDELDMTVTAHGATFAGGKLDLGTRVLLNNLADLPQSGIAVDLGCGAGIIAVELARRGLTVIATDVSAAAVASTAATAKANGVDLEVVQDDAMSTFADASVDLVVCNPPFHMGSTVHTGAASAMFRAAGRVLRPGGEMWTVFNAHLGYRAELGRLVGPTEQIGRDHKFIVTRSVRRKAR